MTDIEFRPVPSYPRYLAGEDGTIVGPSGRKLMPYCIPGNGYMQVLIYPQGRTRVTRRVHTLICEAFHGPKPTPRHEVGHRDGNPGNNAASNLRWVTHVENMIDRDLHGRTFRTAGELNGCVRLTEAQVKEIRQRCALGQSQRSLAAEYGVKQPTISNIITRTTWSHC